MIKYLPNLISVLRIVFSIMILLLIDHDLLFLTTYFICGISDIADGYIARLYHVESEFGSKLDSLSDLIFYGVSLYILSFFIGIQFDLSVLIIIMIILIIRVTNIIIIKIKFHTSGNIHTISNKVTGFLLFLVVPYCYLNNTLSLFFKSLLLIISLYSAIEELIILLTSDTYDGNKRSIFF
jgi:CDP-diacylglycerol--glycerol-3-phosphate 3-phosphatidyltransferase